jgi:hypothetical protein
MMEQVIHGMNPELDESSAGGVLESDERADGGGEGDHSHPSIQKFPSLRGIFVVKDQ